MAVRLVGAVLIAGCASAPAPVETPPPPQPSAPVASGAGVDLGPIFQQPSLEPTETRCRTFPLSRTTLAAAHQPTRKVIFELEDLPLGAIERGPRATSRERRFVTLRTDEVHRPFGRRAAYITSCWKWFAATHPGGNTALDVRLTIDAFGATGAIRIANEPEAADLAACIRDGFAAPMYLYAPSGHERQITVSIEFERADQPPWATLPARPAPIAPEPLPERGTVCMEVTSRRDDLRLSPQRVSDFDDARTPPPPPPDPFPGMPRRVTKMPVVRLGCARKSDVPTRADMRAVVASNAGAYEACHADARSRMPDLAGRIDATLTFGGLGATPIAHVSGPGDAELHACLDRALEDVWIAQPPEGLVIVNIPFVLVADEAPAPLADEAEWRARLARLGSPSEGCAVRHALVKDRMRVIPWIDDARVRAAFGELARYIAAQSATDARACLAEVDTTLQEYTGVDTHVHPLLVERFEARLDRLEAVRPLAAIAPWGRHLEWMIAVVYRKDPARVAEGTAMLEQLSLDPTLHHVVRVEEPPRELDSFCVM